MTARLNTQLDGCTFGIYTELFLLRASCLMLEIDVMRQKIEESEKLVVTGSQTQDTSGLSCQRSATEP